MFIRLSKSYVCLNHTYVYFGILMFIRPSTLDATPKYTNVCLHWMLEPN